MEQPHTESQGELKGQEDKNQEKQKDDNKQKEHNKQKVHNKQKGHNKQKNQEKKGMELQSHIDLGVQLKLFLFDESSPGSCFFLPNGTIILNRLMDFIRGLYNINGYDEVNTPVLCDKSLWNISGHYEKFKSNMFLISNHINDVYEFSLCPMNCPKHTIIFKNMNPSYADLPIRLADFGPLHRNELSGSLRGLTRVRLFHQNDAHIFCTKSQIKDEIKTVLGMMKSVYDKFGFSYELTLSTRPNNFIGDIKMWTEAEEILKDCLKDCNGKSDFKVNDAEGAFYGPKIDALILDSQHKQHQLGTIQLDFNLPGRFGLKYKTDTGYETPIMIHRAILGSLERFIAILLEHTQGKLPFWLSPRQLAILPVGLTHNQYAENVKKELLPLFPLSKVKVHIFDKGSISKRVRTCVLDKFNVIIVVGDNEVKNNSVSVRTTRTSKKLCEYTMSDFKNILQKIYGECD